MQRSTCLPPSSKRSGQDTSSSSDTPSTPWANRSPVVLPLALERGRFRDGRPLAAEDGVVRVALEPAEGVPGAVPPVVFVTFPGLRRDRVRVELLPLVQLVVEGHRHRVSLALLVVADRRHALPVEEAVAAVNAVEQAGGMVAPVEQVGARHVAPVVGLPAQSGVLEDVEQVVAALPVDGAVRVEGHRDAFRHDEVVAGPRGVAQDAFAKFAGAFGGRVVDLRERNRHTSPGAVRLSGHGELEGAVPGRRTELHGVDGCRVSVDDDLGIVQHEALVVIAAPVSLLVQLLLQIGLRRAGTASPSLREEVDLPVDVPGPRRGVVGPQCGQHLGLDFSGPGRTRLSTHRDAEYNSRRAKQASRSNSVFPSGASHVVHIHHGWDNYSVGGRSWQSRHPGGSS